MSAVWRISLSNLSRNLLEATELANVLQEVSSSIQVTGLSSSHSARTSSSASGTPTQLSTRERIRSALPLHIGAATVPWEQLVAVVSSDALQEPPSPCADKQPQLVEVNTGGSVFFLFLKLTKEQYLQQLQLLQQRQQQEQQQQQQDQQQRALGDHSSRQQKSPADTDVGSPASTLDCLAAYQAAADPAAGAAIQELAAVAAVAAANTDTPQTQFILPEMPLLASIASHAADTGTYVREGVVVLKVGFNRLAMQAEQFANELTRHLGIAAPDCRIIRQVGSTADEWNAAMASVNRLANCCSTTTEPISTSSSDCGSPNISNGGCGGCVGCLTSGGAGELLAELSHLPCFLLMEYVEGDRLADSSHALQGQNLGVLLEDVGCLFLLDMLLGNADRMPCRRLGWRGNPNNLLYAAHGTRHQGRPVAIDSCVARRPPAQKASSEDAAVEQLAQLLLSVPEVSRSLLQQLLSNIKREQLGRVSRLSTCSTAGVSAENSGGEPVCTAAMTAVGPHLDDGASTSLGLEQQQSEQQKQLCKATSIGMGAGLASEWPEPADLPFSDEDIARFQAGLRKCLTGVLQIKGLLEMVSSKAADWIAEFVADVVHLNPAVLPSPGGTATGGPAFSPMRSPRPSPRPSMRSSLSSILQGTAGVTSADNSSAHATCLPQQPADGAQSASSHNGSKHNSGVLISYSAAGSAIQEAADCAHSCPATLPPWPPTVSGIAVDSMSAEATVAPPSADHGQVAAAIHRSGGHGSRNSSSCSEDGGDLSAMTQNTGNSPVGKVPLAKRVAGHLGFASIKAAVCSGNTAHNATGNSPTTSSSNTSSSPADSLGVSIPPSSVVEIAVAAALSPRATKAQTQALVGVFGGGGLVASDGGIGSHSGGARPACARRVTWGSVAEGERASKISPRELFTALPSSVEGPASAPSSHSHRATSATGILYLPHYNASSSSRSSVTVMGSHSLSSSGPTGIYSSISVTGPQRTVSSSPMGLQQLSRHLSFPVSPGGNAVAAAAVAAVSTPVLQYTTSSSLQVLASIQLDATLASIKYEARHDGALAERMAHWKAVFREKGAELHEAIASWQARHHLAAVLSTGFLDGSHPIVDVYELGVRLQHMLRRLTALAAGAMVQAPICVMPGVFVGNAVAADSHHLLQYLGVTHVVNAAQELQVETAPGLFQVYRVAIRDEEEEDVSRHFYQVQAWIDAALSSGGAVLVHCHEGKSRSVALLLAYLMISKGYTLKSAMEHIKSVRPEASPNAGFMNQLMTLDLELHGVASMCRKELPRAKPEVRVCSICCKPTGVSSKSLDMHVKRAHGKQAVAAAQGTAVSAEPAES